MSYAHARSLGRATSITWIALVLVGLAFLFVSCSSGEPESSADPTAGSADGAEGTSSSAGNDVASDGGGDGTLPLGTAWETFTVAELDGRGQVSSITTLNDTAWITGMRWNAPVVWRSTDAETWEEIPVAAPDEDLVSFEGILDRDGGGYLGFGNRGSRCRDWTGHITRPVPPGARALDLCRRDRPVIYFSDDGETWRVSEPAAMAPPGDQSTVIQSMSAYPGGFVAVGTVKGPDWHGRVWTSPDGTDWTLAAELRGEEYTTAVQVLSDGEQIVVIAAEHECGEPRDISQGGWVLGTAWANHLRIYQGTDPTALTLLQPGEHPLAVEPMGADCNEISDVEIHGIPYAWARGAVVGGTITLVEREAASDADEDEARVRRITRFVDGEWLTDEVELPPISSTEGALVDIDGRVGIVGDGGPSRGRGRGSLWAVVPTEDGSWEHRDAGNAVIWTQNFDASIDATYFDGAILVGGRVRSELFSSVVGSEDPSSVLVARSRPVSAAEWNACAVEPGTECRYVDFDLVEGAPNFAGVDLSGADLAVADFGGASFDGATFRDAALVGVEGAGARFEDTDFSGADLRGATLAGVARADFTGARLDGARIRFTDAITLDGASLKDSTIEQQASEPGQYRPLEISLAGLDLRRARIEGGHEGALLVVTDLRGATVERTSFRRVDLSRADVTGIDLSQLQFDEESICPGGEPPISESSYQFRCE